MYYYYCCCCYYYDKNRVHIKLIFLHNILYYAVNTSYLRNRNSKYNSFFIDVNIKVTLSAFYNGFILWSLISKEMLDLASIFLTAECS